MLIQNGVKNDEWYFRECGAFFMKHLAATNETF